MFEILVRPTTGPGKPEPTDRRLWIARTAQVHLSFRTHILAAIRLFTCQRASIFRPSSTLASRRSSRRNFTANDCGNFRYRRRGPVWGEADRIVSRAGVNRCERNFSAGTFVASSQENPAVFEASTRPGLE